MEDVKYVCLSSAGTRGIVFLGFLEGIEDHLEKKGTTLQHWHEQLKGVAGTSAGAIVGLVILLGLNREKRNRIFSSLSDASKHINPTLRFCSETTGGRMGTASARPFRTFSWKGGLLPRARSGI